MEEVKKNEPKYIIKPKFNFIYEMIMPTGRKIKNSTFMLLGTIILYIVLLIFNNVIDFNSITDVVNVSQLLNIIFIALIIVLSIKLIIHITFQVLQYKYLSYTFYDDYMIYEDSFLNQHTKTIQYSNIREVEIRRTITDRILGYGIIVIYTNAENRNNGLVIYSIKNPQECYEKIHEILDYSKNYKKDDIAKKNVEENKEEQNVENEEKSEEEDLSDKEKISEIVNFSEEDEKKFNESLKDINE